MPYAAIELLANPLYGTENFLLDSEPDQLKMAMRAAVYSTGRLCVKTVPA